MTNSTDAHTQLVALMAFDDDYALAIRALMIDDADPQFTRTHPLIVEDLAALDREDRTAIALMLSLCPLHMRDYAICFDDDNPECSAIRAIHPSHDT